MDQPAGTIAPRNLVPRRDSARTLATLHMWTLVVGKIRMAQMPALNHWWHVMDGLASLAIEVPIRTTPVEVDVAIVANKAASTARRASSSTRSATEDPAIPTAWAKLRDG
jgi:hypothetical protein